jgi:geranylgeranyl diphosphate synthase type I
VLCVDVAEREVARGSQLHVHDDVRCRGTAEPDARAVVGEDEMMGALRTVGHRHALLDDERRGGGARGEQHGAARREIERRDPLGRQELDHARIVPSRARGAVTVGAYHPAVPVTRRPTGGPPSLAEVGGRAEARIVALLDEEIDRWRAVDAAVEEPLVALRALVLAGGKRLRPAFCHWAFVGAGGDPGDRRVVDAGAALELLHTFALVHDDVMDGSETRRGLPAIHTSAIMLHKKRSWRGEARRFGEGAAILVGDLAFVYADVLFGEADLAARRVFDELRVELCIGQYLDLVGTASGSSDAAQAERIERYKSGKYTVERPLHLGAALAGRLDELAASLSRIGLPLGAAFQLRDDLLGVFGDASVTGKPVGDDLREGKLTPLVAAAAARAGRAGAALLAGLGRSDMSDADVKAIQELLVETGARDEIEREIKRLVDRALQELKCAALEPVARNALEELAVFVAWRDR